MSNFKLAKVEILVHEENFGPRRSPEYNCHLFSHNLPPYMGCFQPHYTTGTRIIGAQIKQVFLPALLLVLLLIIVVRLRPYILIRKLPKVIHLKFFCHSQDNLAGSDLISQASIVLT